MVTFAASATDNCDPSPAVQCNPASGDTFPFGVTPVNCTATDNANNSSGCGFTVEVLTPQQAIEVLMGDVAALVATGALNNGQGNALGAKLRAALRSLDRGQTNAACNQLRAFINQVTDLIAEGVLGAAEGQPLIDTATAIRAALGCRGPGGPPREVIADNPEPPAAPPATLSACGVGSAAAGMTLLLMLTRVAARRRRTGRYG